MHCREVSPRRAALVILDAWFGSDLPAPASTLPLVEFQRDAVARIGSILQHRRGAFLADAVGLGKTFVALAIIEQALQRKEPVALVVPAALKPHWLRHLRRLPASERAPVSVITHTALSFGRSGTRCYGLVVVDEAHAFRNPRTRRYAALSQLTRNARVLLLSATPVNNRLADLYHQIALFTEDHEFGALGIASLRAAFTQATAEPRAQQSVQRVLEAIMVRRSRDHVASPEPGLVFPTRAPPVAVRYDLLAAYGSAWPKVYDALQQLSFAAFSSTGIPAAVELMRLQLLKRLESSVAAFSASLRRQLQINQLLLGSLGNGRWIKPTCLRSLVTAGGDAQLTLDALLTEPVPRGCNTTELHAATNADFNLLRSCLPALEAALAHADPKLAQLQALLAHRRSGVIVFTQYRDTAIYLWRQLLRRGRIGLIHGSEARLGAQRAARTTVIECFAPNANGARLPPARLRLDLLVATDVLSEGLNLQDASTVVSYDLPWNPVTLMQRIGRVDRLGSPHQTVEVYNFLPDRGLDVLLRLLERVEDKLRVIDRAVGAESVLQGVAVGPDARFDGISHLTRLQSSSLNDLAELESLRAQWQAARDVRTHTRVRSSMYHEQDGWLAAVRFGPRVRLLIVDANHICEDAMAASRILRIALAMSEQPKPTLDEAPLQRIRDWLAANAAAQQLEGLPGCASAQSAAIRLLLSHVAVDEPRAELIARADRVLKRLETPLPPALLPPLQAALLSLADADGLLPVVLRLEAVLSARARRKDKQATSFRVLALIRLSRPRGSVDPEEDGR